MKAKKPLLITEIPSFSKWLADVKQARIIKPQGNEILRFAIGRATHAVCKIKQGRDIGKFPPAVLELAQEYISWRDIKQAATPQDTSVSIDVHRLLGSFAGRAKFAKWLDHNGATLLMPDPLRHEVMVFRWVCNGVQVTDHVWGDPRNNRVNCSGTAKHLLSIYQAGQSIKLGGAMPRVKVQNSTIAALINRDGHLCIYCGKSAADAKVLTIEHFIPISHGGTNHLDNLSFACEACNRAAGNLSVAEKIRIRDAIRGAKECAA